MSPEKDIVSDFVMSPEKDTSLTNAIEASPSPSPSKPLKPLSAREKIAMAKKEKQQEQTDIVKLIPKPSEEAAVPSKPMSARDRIKLAKEEKDKKIQDIKEPLTKGSSAVEDRDSLVLKSLTFDNDTMTMRESQNQWESIESFGTGVSNVSALSTSTDMLPQTKNTNKAEAVSTPLTPPQSARDRIRRAKENSSSAASKTSIFANIAGTENTAEDAEGNSLALSDSNNSDTFMS